MTAIRAADTVTPDSGEDLPRVQLRSIVKRFGQFEAVRGVDLALHAGEVHALLGENGAGKTTLMSVLGGLLEPDAGEIRVAGAPVKLRSARRAAQLGIGMVHQHFRLVKGFTVAENLRIGATRATRSSDSIASAAALAERYGMQIDPRARICDLSVGEQQAVEILRALSRGAEILILDEPTAVLTPQESERLFVTLREFADSGKAVVFISHKLREVVGHADRVTVMRHGAVVAERRAGESDERELARLMIGRDLERVAVAAPDRGGADSEPRLTCAALAVADADGRLVLDDVSLRIGSGEIVGVAGVAGNGQRALAEALTGLRASVAGTISVRDRELSNRGPLAFIDAGVGHVPEDRNGTGLAPAETIWRNAVLKCYRTSPVARGWRVRRSVAQHFADRLCELGQLSTRDVQSRVRNLSGGNAQRLMLRREILCSSQALIAAYPTQGLDVGAAQQVRRAMLEARADGIGILLISEDLDELLELSDRIVVLYEGRIVGEFPAERADRDQIGLAMGGAAD
jgi:simple sugar transport system ATP-binding protein